MKMKDTGYWIFNCNPKQWAIDDFLMKGEKLSTWKVTTWQKDLFKKGQFGLIRVGVDNRTIKELKNKEKLQRGIYALVEVLSTAKLAQDNEDVFWLDKQKKEESAWRIDVKYVENYLDRPIMLNDILDLDINENDVLTLQGRQNSSFSISKKTFRKITDLKDKSFSSITNSSNLRNSIKDSIDLYIKSCKKSNWIADEAYKFEFANLINKFINWNSQTDEEVLNILIESQQIKYSGTKYSRGIQFILKSGRENLSEFIGMSDVQILRQVYKGKYINTIDWEERGMSYTGFSAWISSLFPDKFYPVPTKGFNDVIKFLFHTGNQSFPKIGEKYIIDCQSYMAETEKTLRDYPLEDLFLNIWNEFYITNPELNLETKTKLSKVDWVWIVQDFYLFVYRNILNKYKDKPTIEMNDLDNIEPTVVEGGSKLAIHMRYERNSGLIRKIKKQAIEDNKMLNCEVCGFSFVFNYGEIGYGFIEAHHRNPLCERDGETVTKKEDIALVCSNCHRMLHRGKPIYTVKELKDIMGK